MANTTTDRMVVDLQNEEADELPDVLWFNQLVERLMAECRVSNYFYYSFIFYLGKYY